MDVNRKRQTFLRKRTCLLRQQECLARERQRERERGVQAATKLFVYGKSAAYDCGMDTFNRVRSDIIQGQAILHE